ncbi:MAG: hypothetical protein AAFW83_08945 [Pseudomonadota bacterium]
MPDKGGCLNSEYQSRKRCSGGQPALPEALRAARQKMVPDEGETLNSLTDVFDTLQDWEGQIKAVDINYEELGL